jgi:hypothetical protein
VNRLKDVLVLSLKNKGEDSSAADILISTIDENRDGIITKVYKIGYSIKSN